MDARNGEVACSQLEVQSFRCSAKGAQNSDLDHTPRNRQDRGLRKVPRQSVGWVRGLPAGVSAPRPREHVRFIGCRGIRCNLAGKRPLSCLPRGTLAFRVCTLRRVLRRSGTGEMLAGSVTSLASLVVDIARWSNRMQPSMYSIGYAPLLKTHSREAKKAPRGRQRCTAVLVLAVLGVVLLVLLLAGHLHPPGRLSAA